MWIPFRSSFKIKLAASCKDYECLSFKLILFVFCYGAAIRPGDDFAIEKILCNSPFPGDNASHAAEGPK
jgi:hypothetical protein